MKKVKVKITKLAGETGLRLPGSIMLLSANKADALETRGLVEIVKSEPEPKQKRKSKRSK